MPSEAAMRAAKALMDRIVSRFGVPYSEKCAQEWADIIDREMGDEDEQGLALIRKLAQDRHYSPGFFSDLCTRCGHMERFHATDKSCPDHNWNVNCCGGVPK